MSDKHTQFPREEQDRRHRAYSRRDYSDRRASQRFVCDFPVLVHVGEGVEKTSYEAIARNLSDGGILLENVDIPDKETRVRLEFSIPEGQMQEEYVQGRYRLDASIRRCDRERRRVGIAFDMPLSQKLFYRTWLFLKAIGVSVLLIVLSLILLIKVENLYFFWFDVPVFLYSLSVGAFLLSRFLFASCYRPPKARLVEELPTVSIIIPAFNEESYIERTLVSALEVAYPRDKLQVITVDDGSTDRTLDVMQRVRQQYPELVVVEFPKNEGKRHALAVGTKIATGDVIVFVDSDSFLSRDAIRNIIDGFADPAVAAVCGHCEVENKWTNLLCKMQAVRYYISFRVIKAAESLFGAVTCLSGPLAAYRRVVLEEILEEWLNQSFLGIPATFGDDRSLTTYILRNHDVIYDSRALTTTIVPESYRKFWLQQMRWKRSWFRESTRAAAFMYTKQPFMALSFYLGLLLPILCPAVVFRAMIYVPIFQGGTPFMYLFGILLMSGLMSSVYLYAKRSRLWIYGVYFCLFYMFVLVWQLPWAILTYMKSSWDTRTFTKIEVESSLDNAP